MTYSDEQLSAFLDGELPREQMDILRLALTQDESLAERLAELALADRIVAETYSTIDARPLPGAVTGLLAPEPPATGKVLAFPSWRRLQQPLQRHAAMAASVALVIGIALGLGTGNLLQPADGGQWPQLAAVLEQQPSGASHRVAEDIQVRPRLTFVDHGGHYCRQYQVLRGATAEESIACRRDGSWQPLASVFLPRVDDDSDYLAASGGSVLDDLLDRTMATEPFDRDRESAAIRGGWHAGGP